jgi:hypothetical protein
VAFLQLEIGRNRPPLGGELAAVSHLAVDHFDDAEIERALAHAAVALDRRADLRPLDDEGAVAAVLPDNVEADPLGRALVAAGIVACAELAALPAGNARELDPLGGGKGVGQAHLCGGAGGQCRRTKQQGKKSHGVSFLDRKTSFVCDHSSDLCSAS